MNCWFTCNLGDAMLSGEPLEHIKEVFLAEYATNDSVNERALFVRHESEGRLHCEVIVYVSPATVRVAKAVSAIPCNKPCAAGLGLLAGTEKSWSVLFPEKSMKGE